MPDELQVIVDALATRLGRAVDVEDKRFRVIAYSRHDAAMDSVRIASILRREAPPDVRRYLDSSGLASITAPTRVRAPAGLAMDERVCVPVRWGDALLGYLWLIDGERTLTDEDLAAASDAAETAGIVLYREQSLGQLSRRQERRLLHELLNEDGRQRAEAATALIERDVLVESAQVAAAVITLRHSEREALPQSIRVTLASALEQLRRETMPGHVAWVLQPNHGVLLSSMLRGSDPAATLHVLAERLCAHVDAALANEGAWQAHVGVGDPVDALVEVHRSHAQALAAARIAWRVEDAFDRIALWCELGAYQLLSAVPADTIAGLDGLPPGLVELLRTPGGDTLAATLETYLDRAGDAKATATALHLHRSSLYYRLHKAETITGTDLRCGGDRLLLHMGLKLARLAGHYPAPVTQPLRRAG